MSKKKYVLAEDVVFPKGSEVAVLEPGSSTSYEASHAFFLASNGPDSVVRGAVDLEESLATGIVVEA